MEIESYLNEAVSRIIDNFNPEKIILFGSVARGDADEFSDLDVVLIKQTQLPFVQRGVDASKCLRPELAPVNLFVYTPEEFRRMIQDESPFIEQVLAEGRVLYEEAA